MDIQHFYEPETGSLSYVVHDGRVGVVIDPVQDYNAASQRASWSFALSMADYIERHTLSIAYVIDTHTHADHLTGIPFFQDRYQATSVTGSGFKLSRVELARQLKIELGDEEYDLYLCAGDTLSIGTLTLEALATPGHTPAHLSLRVNDAVFLGDTLFAPDQGTARTDFPGGSAAELYESIQHIYALPDATRLFLAHDYPENRAMMFETTVGEQKQANVQLNAQTTKTEYVKFRTERDRQLAAPRLFIPAMQANLRVGVVENSRSPSMSNFGSTQ